MRKVWLLTESLQEYEGADAQLQVTGVYGSLEKAAKAFLKALDWHLTNHPVTDEILQESMDNEWLMGTGHDVVDGILKIKLGALKKEMQINGGADVSWNYNTDECFSVHEVVVQ